MNGMLVVLKTSEGSTEYVVDPSLLVGRDSITLNGQVFAFREALGKIALFSEVKNTVDVQRVMRDGNRYLIAEPRPKSRTLDAQPSVTQPQPFKPKCRTQAQWKLVPSEPNMEMQEAVRSAWESDGPISAKQMYKAMIDTAPVPHAGDVEVLASLGLTLAVLNEAFNAQDSAERFSNMDVPRVIREAFKDFERIKTEFTRQTAERDELKALSVTNIMIDVVPGDEGMGEEVYAKSVSEIEAIIAKQDEQIEDLTAERDDLKAEVERLTKAEDNQRARVGRAHTLLAHVREARDSFQRVGIQAQSELTKARELLQYAYDHSELLPNEREVDAFLVANQPAPSLHAQTVGRVRRTDSEAKAEALAVAVGLNNIGTV